jgi:hypothetical protein
MNGDFLHELHSEVEADLSMVESGRPREAVMVPPSDWTTDPAEIEREEIGLRSLLGAVETMEGDSTG